MTARTPAAADRRRQVLPAAVPGPQQVLPAVAEVLPGAAQALPGVAEVLPGVAEVLPAVGEVLPAVPVPVTAVKGAPATVDAGGRGAGAGRWWSAAQVAGWVARSCAAQGVPVLVRDPLVVAQVAALLGARPAPGPARRAHRAGVASASEPPDGVDAVEVHGAGAGPGWGDDGVVEDRGDDGGLAGQGQRRPRVA